MHVLGFHLLLSPTATSFTGSLKSPRRVIFMGISTLPPSDVHKSCFRRCSRGPAPLPVDHASCRPAQPELGRLWLAVGSFPRRQRRTGLTHHFAAIDGPWDDLITHDDSSAATKTSDPSSTLPPKTAPDSSTPASPSTDTTTSALNSSRRWCERDGDRAPFADLADASVLELLLLRRRRRSLG